MDGRNAANQAQSKMLFQEHKHEAAEHRRILFERGSGLSPSWKDFRTFLHDLCPAPSPWMSEERRDAFLVGYRMWHMQIQPHYASEATPSFLFIFGSLPNMLKIKQQLIEISLWDPPTQKGKEQRQNHDLWRRY